MADPAAPHHDPAPVLAAQMVENMAILNDNITRLGEVLGAVVEKLDDICGYHETFIRAMELLLDQADDGKSKWSLRDLAKAMADAADEVMPADDEPGDEDPLVPNRG